MDLSQTPGDRLKKARQLSGLSKDQVCKAVPCGRITLWRWEEGRSEMSAAHFARLAELYGVSMDDLWFGERRAGSGRGTPAAGEGR
jgi:transcriptional regulator with XRE-family HTH domain